MVTLDINTFNFEYWNNNRISILCKLIQAKQIDDVRTMAFMVGLNYASTYNIILDFQKKKLIQRQGRMIILSQDWEKTFMQMHR